MMDLLQLKHLLPKSVQTMIALIGPDATEKLIESMGGTVLFVPKGMTKAGKASYESIAECIGHDAADALCKAYGGAPIEIPNCHRAVAALKHRQIRAEFDQLVKEYSARQAYSIMARTKRMTSKQIRNIVNLPDVEAGPPAQLTLL